MHVSASCKTAAISENNATLEDLKSTQDDVLPTAQGKTYQGHGKATYSRDI